jgi:CRP/FNR family transcriptional regulator
MRDAPAPRLRSDDIDRLSEAGRVEAVARRRIVPLDVPVVVVVMDGYFRVFRNSAFAKDVTLGLASAGDVLAPGVAFGDASAETGAEALSDGHVLMLAREAWEEVASAEPRLYLQAAGSIGRRLVRLQKRAEQFSRATAEARVAALLIELADDYGTPAASGVKLDLTLSQEDLARLAGTTRETASGAIASFARMGFVKGGRLKGMLVLDLEALRALAL